jgi:tRNA pseudouridine38-40 synthase
MPQATKRLQKLSNLKAMNQPVDPQVDGLVRYRADFAYDGTNFAGWAKQPDLRTVHGEVITALETIFGETQDDFGMRVAGRTDAGVHATGQVLHFDLEPSRLKRLGRDTEFLHRLNGLLPADVQFTKIELAPEGFDARFSAAFRRYRYRIADDLAFKNPLSSRYTLWFKRPLDTAAMQSAAQHLKGLHDFASFCRPREGATTIRELKKIEVTRNVADGNVIEIELVADAFCHNMVRSIVGALIATGVGKATPDDILRVLKQASRVGAYKVVAPEGLTLVEVGYPPDDQLQAQADRARDTRSLDEN